MQQTSNNTLKSLHELLEGKPEDVVGTICETISLSMELVELLEEVSDTAVQNEIPLFEVRHWRNFQAGLLDRVKSFPK
jgi:hypothetical protein